MNNNPIDAVAQPAARLTPDEQRTATATRTAAAPVAPPVVSFDSARGQFIATYANGAILGYDGKNWSAEALILDTVEVTASRFTPQQAARFDELTAGGLGAQIASSIIDRQRAHDRAIANPANFSADLRFARQSGIPMDTLIAARAAALPRELRGAATMQDAPGGELGFWEGVWNATGRTVSDVVHRPGDALLGAGKAIPNAVTGTVELIVRISRDARVASLLLPLVALAAMPSKVKVTFLEAHCVFHPSRAGVSAQGGLAFRRMPRHLR